MILLSSPNLSGNELKYVKECIDTEWVSSVGSYVDKFENMVAEYVGAKYAIASSSGTTALHIALIMHDVQQNDLVIVPNLTFVASVNSIKYTGANPLLIDVDEQSWQMDLNLLEQLLVEETEQRDGFCFHKDSGKRIKAIMPVHVLGNMGDMTQLVKLARERNIVVIEDSTESLGTSWNGKHSGTFGQMGCFSFNGNKIITTGGGGMLVTDSEALAKRAKHLTTQAKADPKEYYHDAVGYNYRLTNMNSAMGAAQMEQLPSFIERKKEINAFYRKELGGLGDMRFQQVSEEVDCNYWLFTFRTSKQSELLNHLNSNKIQSRPFWVPMNQLPMFKDDIYYAPEKISNLVYKDALSIPSSTHITDDQLEQVVREIKRLY